MHKLIVANFKMNGDKKFYLHVNKLFNKLKLQDTKIILCPPFVYLPFLKSKNKNIKIGSQDITSELDNKSTGQIGPKMLKEFNVEYCLIGHYERRKIGESEKVINQKINVAIQNNIQPIICVGTDNVNDLKSLKEQVESALNNQLQFSPIFAYEPNWAINGDEVPSVEEINLAVSVIQKMCAQKGFTSKVLYGGGVDLKTYQLIKDAKVDGFLLGGICLNINETIELIKGVENE